MNITFDNNISCSSPIHFKGKGIDLVNIWMRDENIDGIRLNYYKEIMRDLSEGAKLYFEKNPKVDNSVKNSTNPAD